MAESSANDDSNHDAGERLGEMVVEWAEAWCESQRLPKGSERHDDALQAFMAGALTVFQRWDEVRPLVPRRRVSWRDLPSHHG